MAFLSSLDISGSALTATRLRMDVISENIAHQSTTRTDGKGTPYRRKMVVYKPIEDNSFRAIFQRGLTSVDEANGVKVTEIVEDPTDFKPVYNPQHPDANEQGYVLMPNVDPLKETIDMMAATRAYDANITSFNAVKGMISKVLEMGR